MRCIYSFAHCVFCAGCWPIVEIIAQMNSWKVNDFSRKLNSNQTWCNCNETVNTHVKCKIIIISNHFTIAVTEKLLLQQFKLLTINIFLKCAWHYRHLLCSFVLQCNLCACYVLRVCGCMNALSTNSKLNVFRLCIENCPWWR